MLVDHRYYRIKPGMVAAHLDLYEQAGFKTQSRYLGQPFAYLYTESGEVNTLVHMWVYDDVADRARKRAAMAADPEMAELPAPPRRVRLPGFAAEQPDASRQFRADEALTARSAGARPPSLLRCSAEGEPRTPGRAGGPG